MNEELKIDLNRMVINIDVGNMSAKDAEAYINKVIVKYHDGKIPQKGKFMEWLEVAALALCFWN